MIFNQCFLKSGDVRSSSIERDELVLTEAGLPSWFLKAAALPTSTIARRSGSRYERATRCTSSAESRHSRAAGTSAIRRATDRRTPRSAPVARWRRAFRCVSGKLPVMYACAPASSWSLMRSRCSRQNSSTISLTTSPVASGPRVGFGREVARQQHRVHVGGRGVGQAAIRAQHAVEPIAALAAENPNRLVERHVVRRLSRHAELTHAHGRLDRVRLVHHDDAARGLRRRGQRRHRHRLTRPVAEHALRRRHGLPVFHVAHDGQDAVVRREVFRDGTRRGRPA